MLLQSVNMLLKDCILLHPTAYYYKSEDNSVKLHRR
jgi:hypothetical protein